MTSRHFELFFTDLHQRVFGNATPNLVRLQINRFFDANIHNVVFAVEKHGTCDGFILQLLKLILLLFVQINRFLSR